MQPLAVTKSGLMINIIGFQLVFSPNNSVVLNDDE